jgi:hypothetical protein
MKKGIERRMGSGVEKREKKAKEEYLCVKYLVYK